jgi:hypothetical protein
MAVKVTVTSGLSSNDATLSTQVVRGTLTLSGNYGTASSHGDTVSFANVYGIQSRSVPLRVFIYEQPPAGTAPSFYDGIFQPGTTIANGAVNFNLAGTEYTQGSAYSGALSTAVWNFEAVFPTFV